MTVAELETVDLAVTPLRELNQRLHDCAPDAQGARRWRIANPNGAHAVASGSTPSSRSRSTATWATTAPA